MSVLGVMLLAGAVVMALAVGILVGATLTCFGDQQLDLLRSRLMAEQRIEHLTRSTLQAMRDAARRGGTR